MSKQATLFRAWGPGSSKQPTEVAEKRQETALEETDEVIELSEKDLEEFFEDDDLLDETHTASNAAPTDAHNSSLYEDIPGFDSESGDSYVYPINYPLRDYQYNIVKKCLFKNTLVCLPTGLGKTFIAAVVMYNFYRWYPQGKVVFLAPTKPLVAQQIEACYGVMGISQSHTAEMTGSMAPKERQQRWIDKRVFFLTPQVMQNDLARGTCPATAVSCVVFDEAHKALGNHSYCQVIRELTSARGKFRVLALSATPGSDLKAVQQVVTNLLIAQIEMRSEESLDVRQYIHERKIEKIVVPLEGEIAVVHSAFVKILSGVVSRLARVHKVIFHYDIERLSKFQMLQARTKFRETSASGPQSGAIEGDFALSISLFHAYELLQQHGMRSFYQFLSTSIMEGHSRSRMELSRDPAFTKIMSSLGEKLGPQEPVQLNSSMYCPVSQGNNDFFYSHPKLRKLEEVVTAHFRSCQDGAAGDSGGGSRVMIFSQYRESVREIADMLSQHAPLVKVMSFMGQASSGKATRGQTQKEQLEVVRQFRHGGYNTLVSTCVGEEGLDIGEVDLIVCFDAHKSPVRLIQRMGRTGRKRKGRIVVIVAQGKEEQIYHKSQSNKTSIHRAIRDSCRSLQLYAFSPRMIPCHLNPVARKVHMNIGEYVSKNKSNSASSSCPRQRQQGQLSFGPPKNDPRGIYLTDEELLDWSKQYALSDREASVIENAVDGCLSHSPLLSVKRLQGVRLLSNGAVRRQHGRSYSQGMTLSLDRWVHLQTAPVRPRSVKPSSRSEQLCSVLETIEVLQSSSHAGENYDLEMSTFLDRDDVCVSPEKATGEDTCMRGENQRRRAVVLLDSSDDEDFEPRRPSAKHHHEQDETESTEMIVNSEEKTDSISYSPTSDSTLPLSHSMAAPPSCPINSSLAAVPKPPSMDSLNWLDTISVTPAHQPHRISSAHSATNTATAKEQFVSPKNCLSSRYRREQEQQECRPHQSPNHRSPSRDQAQTSHNSVIVLDSFEDSVDFFDGISLTELLDVDLSDAESEITERESDLCDIQKKNSLSTTTGVATPFSTSGSVSVAAIPISKCVNAPKSPSPSLLSPSHITPHPCEHLPISTPDSEEKFLNARRAPNRQLRTNRRLPFLLTQETPSTKKAHPSPQKLPKKGGPSREAPRRLAPHDFSSDDEDFMLPLMKRLKRNETTTAAVSPSLSSEEDDPQDLIENEAEVSDCNEEDADLDTSCDSYDCDDSFINDTSVLTQEVSLDRSRLSPANVTAMYRQSLMSPTGAFARPERRGHGNQYRLVMSQRYKLLNQYIDKAGMEVSASARKRTRPASTEEMESEAEEVMEHCSESELSSEEGEEIDVGSMEEEGAMEYCDESELSSEEERDDGGVDEERAMETYPAAAVAATYISNRTIARMKRNNILISPSLLVSTTDGPVPAEFSLRFSEEWSENDLEEGEEETLQRTDTKHATAAPAQSPSCSHSGAVIVDPKELTTSQIVSRLRNKHHLKVCPFSLGHSGFIISNRAVVERRLLSGMCSSGGCDRTLAALRRLEELYDRVYLIIESNNSLTKATNSTGGGLEIALAKLALTSDVKVLHSRSQDCTAEIMAGLVKTEDRKGHGITASLDLMDQAENKVKMLMKIPNVTAVTALNMVSCFPTLADLMLCSGDQLRNKIPSLSASRARVIVDFFRRKYDRYLVA